MFTCAHSSVLPLCFQKFHATVDSFLHDARCDSPKLLSSAHTQPESVLSHNLPDAVDGSLSHSPQTMEIMETLESMHMQTNFDLDASYFDSASHEAMTLDQVFEGDGQHGECPIIATSPNGTSLSLAVDYREHNSQGGSPTREQNLPEADSKSSLKQECENCPVSDQALDKALTTLGAPHRDFSLPSTTAGSLLSVHSSPGVPSPSGVCKISGDSSLSDISTHTGVTKIMSLSTEEALKATLPITNSSVATHCVAQRNISSFPLTSEFGKEDNMSPEGPQPSLPGSPFRLPPPLIPLYHSNGPTDFRVVPLPHVYHPRLVKPVTIVKKEKANADPESVPDCSPPVLQYVAVPVPLGPPPSHLPPPPTGMVYASQLPPPPKADPNAPIHTMPPVTSSLPAPVSTAVPSVVPPSGVVTAAGVTVPPSATKLARNVLSNASTVTQNVPSVPPEATKAAPTTVLGNVVQTVTPHCANVFPSKTPASGNTIAKITTAAESVFPGISTNLVNIKPGGTTPLTWNNIPHATTIPETRSRNAIPTMATVAENTVASPGIGHSVPGNVVYSVAGVKSNMTSSVTVVGSTAVCTATKVHISGSSSRPIPPGSLPLSPSRPPVPEAATSFHTPTRSPSKPRMGLCNGHGPQMHGLRLELPPSVMSPGKFVSPFSQTSRPPNNGKASRSAPTTPTTPTQRLAELSVKTPTTAGNIGFTSNYRNGGYSRSFSTVGPRKSLGGFGTNVSPAVSAPVVRSPFLTHKTASTSASTVQGTGTTFGTPVKSSLQPLTEPSTPAKDQEVAGCDMTIFQTLSEKFRRHTESTDHGNHTQLSREDKNNNLGVSSALTPTETSMTPRHSLNKDTSMDVSVERSLPSQASPLNNLPPGFVEASRLPGGHHFIPLSTAPSPDSPPPLLDSKDFVPNGLIPRVTSCPAVTQTVSPARSDLGSVVGVASRFPALPVVSTASLPFLPHTPAVPSPAVDEANKARVGEKRPRVGGDGSQRSPGAAVGDLGSLLVIAPQVPNNSISGLPGSQAVYVNSHYHDLRSPDSGFNETCVSPTDAGQVVSIPIWSGSSSVSPKIYTCSKIL